MSELTKMVRGRALSVHHPDRLYFPESGWTKMDVMNYYEAVWPYLQPHLQKRPVTWRVFPQGIHGFSFYRRDAGKNSPPLARSFPYRERSKEKTIRLLVVEELYTLLWLVARGGLEYHLWACTIEDLEHPDWAIFDLDVSEGTPFGKLLEVSLLLREELEGQGHLVLAKTSGGTGMHLYVPLSSKQSFEEVRLWVKGLAVKLADKRPDLILSPDLQRKTHLGDKVAIDYAQNARGKNTAAPYTLRARPGAPVSTPLSWEEIEQGGFTPSDFNLRTLPERLKKVGDLFSV